MKETASEMYSMLLDHLCHRIGFQLIGSMRLQSSICKYHLISSVIRVFTVFGGDMIDSKQGDEVFLLGKLARLGCKHARISTGRALQRQLLNFEEDTRIGELFWCNIQRAIRRAKD